MFTIRFSDKQKTEYEYLAAEEREEFFNGSGRRVLVISADVSGIDISVLNILVSTEDNLSSITLMNTDAGVTNVYEDYVLKLGVSIEPILVMPETPAEAAIYADRLILKIGKRTYIENALHSLGVK